MNLLAVNVFVGFLNAYQLKRKWECVRQHHHNLKKVICSTLFTFVFAVTRTAKNSQSAALNQSIALKIPSHASIVGSSSVVH